MSHTLKNIVVIGASGMLGSKILEALRASPTGFNITIVSRPDSKAQFPEDLSVLRADYTDEESLYTAFKGQDAIVCAVPRDHNDLQVAMINAAARAGVKHFIPSEYGQDLTDPKTFDYVPKPVLAPKIKIVDLLKTKESSGMSWTAPISGLLFDWGLTHNSLDMDFEKRTYTLYDSDKPGHSTVTTTQQAALAVASILSKPESVQNRYVFIQSFVITRQDLFKGLKEITPGEEWTTNEVSTYDLEKENNEKIANGDKSGGYTMLKVLAWREGTPCGFGRYKNDNKLLGLPTENLVEILRTVLLPQK